MNVSVQKWGNSLALRIPSALAKNIYLRQGSLVKVPVLNSRMMKPNGQKK